MILQKQAYQNRLNLLVALFLLMGLLQSCGPTRHLNPNEYLLRKNNISLKTTQTYSDKTELKDALKSVLQQKNNTYLFGAFPVKAWIYNSRRKVYEKDTTRIELKSELAEKPVVYNPNSVSVSTKNMKSLLFNMGYFDAEVSASTDTFKKRITVNYLVDAKSEYLVDTIRYVVDSSKLQERMQAIWEKNTMVKRSMRYSNALLSEERSHMVNQAREEGFYKFNTDNIQFELDTTENRRLRNRRSVVENAANILAGKIKNERPTVSVTTIVKEQEHYDAFDQFRLKNVYIYPDYVDNEAFFNTYKFETPLKGYIYRYKQARLKVRSNIIRSKIALKSGALFRQSDYNKTLLQLNDIAAFNYARIFITEEPNNNDTAIRDLNAHIVLSHGKRYDFNTNFELSGGDLYLAGSAINASVINKNLFRGANQLSLSGNYGFELNQTKNAAQGFFDRFYVSTQNFGLNTKLIAPQFIAPFGVKENQFGSPKTVFNLGVNFLDRSNYFRIRTINSSIGYVWKSGPWTTWQVNPLFFNTLQISNISDSFQARLDRVQAIRNSYQENFILGENIEFIHNTEGKLASRHHFVRLGLEESGMLLQGIDQIQRGINNKAFNFNFANYIRLDFDLRQYFNRQSSALVFRMHGGIGVPYARSSTLPYIKQYFVGGAYSIRGWGPRLLGPGSYLNPSLNNTQDRLFIDQSGDIKLEWNAEYRFRMIQIFAGAIGLHGAVFADAGNIWLAKKDEALPGAEFAFNKLYQDIALSCGAGLRADIGGFLILRADWAFPIKKPYIHSNKGWVVDKIDFGSKQWRYEHINLNIGIGMPF
jgi:outer membrane protein insertion porin family